jgi:CelD/BcsL family acetyltransferase involved in cellulose biosynthesis
MSIHTSRRTATIKTSPTHRTEDHRKTGSSVSCQLLSPAEYAEWDRLVDRSVHGTVFHYSWWLEATAQRFQILVVRDRDGNLLGGIPLPSKRSAFVTLYHSPQLTPYLGPIFDLNGISGNYDRLYAMRCYGEMLARTLPQFDSFRYSASAAGPDLQGFLWAGFRITLAYTFRFSAGLSPDELTSAMSRTHAQKISKAKRLQISVRKEADIDKLIDLNRMIFARHNQEPPFSPDLVKRLWSESLSRSRARLYVAYTADGIPAAGLLTVNDNRTTFQIISGVNTAMPDLPGGNLVLWTALQEAVAEGRDFDFEGSSLRGVEVFYRRWGAAAVPVWTIEKTGSVRGSLVRTIIERQAAAKRKLTEKAAG